MALNAKSLLLIGRMGRAHGVRGEIRIIPETDDPGRFSALNRLYIGEAVGSAQAFSVRSVRYQNGRGGPVVLVAFEGVDDREGADRFRKKLVFAAEEDLPPLDDDEYFIHDLIGCSVVDVDGKVVGTLRDVLDLPAHHVYAVGREGLPDALIPAVPAFIEDVDVKAQRIVIRSIEGLLDD
jgi:16S rRNA processing protein RimM